MKRGTENRMDRTRERKLSKTDCNQNKYNSIFSFESKCDIMPWDDIYCRFTDC
jgi:hypothetical protein